VRPSVRRRSLLAATLALFALAAPAFAIEAPPPEPAALAALVGEYGEGASAVTVLEREGRLLALQEAGERITETPLDPVADFTLAPSSPPAVRLNGTELARTDIGAARIMQIRAGVRRDLEKLRTSALAASPPSEPPSRARSDLVELSSLDPSIHLDIRYAGSDNFMGEPLYEKAAAYMQHPAAEAVARANRTLAAQGYGLLIHDAYRPWYVTKMFWDAVMPEAHVFVADPAKGSRHNRGCAVDLTLYELTTGKPVVMTGRYDEMSPRSYADYRGGTSRQRWLRDLLRRAMEAEGFSVYPQEWWHFDYKGFADYPIGNATFTELEAARRR
jgi:D-alanyl-D-alanine dipeptidase